jgi:hypothetical protein
MLRLIKLAIYAGAAYAIYEIVQGMLEQEHLESGGMGRGGRGRRDLNRALDSDSGRMQALTGAGMGQRVETLDRDGGSVPHQVGRGVLVQ